ncbi:MAG: hypothetical protein WBD36_10450 [Bacteroidota bacterium]
MGSSKGVLLSGVALIIGFYTVGIKRAETATAAITATHASTAVAENLARTGLRFAINDLSNNAWAPTTNSIKFYGVFSSKDTVKYSIAALSSNQATVTTTGTYNSIRVKLTATVTKTDSYRLSKRGKKSGYKWEVSDVYVRML